jgi:hypothetical protein
MSGEIKEEIQDIKESQEVPQEIKEVEIEEDIKEEPKKESKKITSHEEIVETVEATKQFAQSKYNDYLKSEEELDEVIKDFIEQENKILDSTVNDAIELLNKLQVDSLADENRAISQIQKDNQEQLITIKKPSKGIGKGFFTGLIATAVTAGGILAYGAKLANLPLNSATFMQKNNLDTIALKLAELINLKGSAYGYALIGAVSLLVGAIFYKIITLIQVSKNSKYVEKIQKDTQEFIENLEYKMYKIGSLKEHIEHIKLVMQKYDIILQEQNAKIRRMLFIEQPEDGINSLQRASKLEVEKTLLILDELLKLMNTSVNEGVEIKQESKERLHSANSVINEVIKKLYV